MTMHIKVRSYFNEVECGNVCSLCGMCSAVLVSTSLKLSKLNRHFETKPPSSIIKALDFFKRQAE